MLSSSLDAILKLCKTMFSRKLFPSHCITLYVAVFRIRIRLNPFHFGQPDPDPGNKKSAKIMENSHKNQLKS